MNTKFTESIVEDAALAWLEGLGYTVLHGPDIAVGMPVDEDLSCWLICEWYLVHREAGGEPDPVAKAILVDVAGLEASGIAALQPGCGFAN
jgi:hypothetical protein